MIHPASVFGRSLCYQQVCSRERDCRYAELLHSTCLRVVILTDHSVRFDCTASAAEILLVCHEENIRGGAITLLHSFTLSEVLVVERLEKF